MDVEDIEPHPNSQEGLDNVMLAVGALETTKIALSAPSTSGVIMAGISALLSVSEVRAPLPYSTAATQWNAFAETLSDGRDNILDMRDRIAGEDEELWSGPGAEAFVDYVDSTLKPAFNGLKDAAEGMADSFESNAEELSEKLDSYYSGSLWGIGRSVAAKALLWIPVYGWALHDLAINANNAWWWVEQTKLVTDLISALESGTSASNDLNEAIMLISQAAGIEGENGPDAQNHLESQIPDELGDHEEWEPA